MGRTITAARAKAIARDWHGGGNTALATLATVGRLNDDELPRALREVYAELDNDDLSVGAQVELSKLRRWLEAEEHTRGL